MSSPNTTPLTYNGYVSQVGTMAVVETQTVNGIVQGVDAYFNSIIPQMLNYAELRIQRDLDLLPLQANNDYALVTGNPTLAISVNDFVVLQNVTVTVGGASVTVLPVAQEFIQNVCPATATRGPPKYFAMIGGDQATGGNTYNNVLFGPPPDADYTVTIFGTMRMPTLYQFSTDPQSAAMGTTFISVNLPDLLLMASMIYISAYQRNFGRLSDQPEMAMSYEQQYQLLHTSAATEEARKKFAASAWSPQLSPPAATPTR